MKYYLVNKNKTFAEVDGDTFNHVLAICAKMNDKLKLIYLNSTRKPKGLVATLQVDGELLFNTKLLPQFDFVSKVAEVAGLLIAHSERIIKASDSAQILVLPQA